MEIERSPYLGRHIWAWVATMPNGRETLIGTMVENGQRWAPLITNSEKLAHDMGAIASHHRTNTGQRIRLVEYREVDPS
jgi:hypothetical protein